MFRNTNTLDVNVTTSYHSLSHQIHPNSPGLHHKHMTHKYSDDRDKERIQADR